MAVELQESTSAGRDQWLAERRTGLGSSDAAAICGLSPWRTAWEIYLDKTGQLPEVEPTPEMTWGLRHEPAIAAAYAEQTGCELSKPRLMRHPEKGWMLASIDRMTDSGRIVELKTASPFHSKVWGEAGSDQIPEQYLVQVQHQMAVAGVDVADVAVLVGLADFRIYTVRRSDKLIADLIEIEAGFWDAVLSTTPPPPDWSKARAREIMKAVKPHRGETIDLDGDAILELNLFLKSKEEEKKAKGMKEYAQAQLTYRMGKAAVAHLADGRTIERKTISRRGYTVEPCEYQTFTVKE